MMLDIAGNHGVQLAALPSSRSFHALVSLCIAAAALIILLQLMGVALSREPSKFLLFVNGACTRETQSSIGSRATAATPQYPPAFEGERERRSSCFATAALMSLSMKSRIKVVNDVLMPKALSSISQQGCEQPNRASLEQALQPFF